jgi:hypothetical protein
MDVSIKDIFKKKIKRLCASQLQSGDIVHDLGVVIGEPEKIPEAQGGGYWLTIHMRGKRKRLDDGDIVAVTR